MRKLNLAQVKTWKITTTRTPAPFPGKDPLRMAFDVHFQWGKPVQYIGKFDWQLLDRIKASAQRRPVTEAWSAVFDRKNLITYAYWKQQLHGFINNPFYYTNINERLRQYYLPFTGRYTHLDNYIHKFQVGKLWFYHWDKPTVEQIAQHAKWLEAAKLTQKVEEKVTYHTAQEVASRNFWDYVEQHQGPAETEPAAGGWQQVGRPYYRVGGRLGQPIAVQVGPEEPQTNQAQADRARETLEQYVVRVRAALGQAQQGNAAPRAEQEWTPRGWDTGPVEPER